MGHVCFFLFIDYGITSGRIREMISVPVACVVLPSFLLLFKGYSKLLPYVVIVAYCCLWFIMMMNGRPPYQSTIGLLF
jgi:hypothetical protein